MRGFTASARRHIRRTGLLLLAVLLALVLLGSIAYAQITPAPSSSYPATQIVVGLKAKSGTTTVSSLASKLGLKVTKQLPALKSGLLTLPKTRDAKAYVAFLKKLPEVRFAELNYRRQLFALSAPDDPGYNDTDPGTGYTYQWDLLTIDALGGWSIWPNTYYTSATKPTDAIKAAVIDTGIDPDHEDFINVGGSSSDAALGGQLDLTDGTGILLGSTISIYDEWGHGTHTSGTIAAAANNGQSYVMDGGGIAGLGYNGQIMTIRIYTADDGGYDSDIAAAIVYAADHGAKVINLSLGGPGYSQVTQDAINYAWQHGTLTVAAAGNDGCDCWPNYPAAHDRVLAVSATGNTDDIASYSTWGDYVGIAAPGGDWTYTEYGIWSTVPRYTVPEADLFYYDYMEGTSMACPHVVGLATLYAGYYKEVNAVDATPLQIYQAIQKGADGVGGTLNGGWGSMFGYGRINVYNTMAGVDPRGSTVGCITGQVTQSGYPASGVLVTATPLVSGTTRSTTTRDEDGCYRLENLEAGTYAVTASYAGLTATLDEVEVSAGCDTPGTDIAISYPPGGAIAGTVSYPTSAYPKPVVNVWVRKSTAAPGQWVAKITSDYNGNYVIPSLLAGTYTMQFSGFGLRAKSVSGVAVTLDGTTWKNVSLTR